MMRFRVLAQARRKDAVAEPRTGDLRGTTIWSQFDARELDERGPSTAALCRIRLEAKANEVPGRVSSRRCRRPSFQAGIGG